MVLTQRFTHPAVDPDAIESSAMWIESHPTTNVRIDSLVFDDSPAMVGNGKPDRTQAQDPRPVIVHRPTLRVIDGVHRVRAAVLAGRTEITAWLLDSDQAAVFVLSVKASVPDGSPRSRADRLATAAHFLSTHPQWSDRAIAAATGISDKTVSRIRSGWSSGQPAQPDARLGRDGRVRSMDGGQRRRAAAAILVDRPDAGLREVARVTRLSPATVRDVRQRLLRGDDPVPDRYRGVRGAERAPGVASPRRPPQVTDRVERAIVPMDRRKLLASLSEDPSLRLNDAGRRALRWLHHYSIDGITTVEHALPCHWAEDVADLARGYATAWSELAARLRERAAGSPTVRGVHTRWTPPPAIHRQPADAQPPSRYVPCQIGDDARQEVFRVRAH